MENPLLVGLSRQVALRRELDVISNNVANIGTTGFKAENVVFEEFLMPQARVDDFRRPDRRPSFVVDRATYTDFGQGPVQQTGNPLDVSLSAGAFFVVETPQGERFTRNGAFQINPQGELVTVDGRRVLGEAGPIVFEPGDRDVTIARDGTVSTPGGARGRIRTVAFENDQRLRKTGDNLFEATGGAQPQPAEFARVEQGTIEKANVRPVTEIARLMEVTRAYTTMQSLIDRGQELRRDAIERLAQVPN